MNKAPSSQDAPYAGFWLRPLANLLDSFILLPAIALGWWASSSRAASLALVVPITASAPLYSLYMHARWGQTLGKMVAGIRVVTVTGSRISWREALLRDSVGMAFAALATASLSLGMLHLPESAWHGRRETMALLVAAQPRWSNWASTASSLWVWSELLVLLCNKHRRALHDFIAGTIVTRVSP